ncbi:hypothetical protein C0995_015421, partial [Termitomyces sp. Mi166
ESDLSEDDGIYLPPNIDMQSSISNEDLSELFDDLFIPSSTTKSISKTQHFLNNLGVSDIAEAIEDITTGLVALQEHKSKIDIADTMVTLDNLTSELLSNTDQHGAPALAIQVSHIWNSIQDLERHIDISGAEKRLA